MIFRDYKHSLVTVKIHRDLKYAFLFASVHGKYSVVGYFGERFAVILIHFVNADVLRDCLDGKHTVRKANKSHTFAYVGIVGNFFGNYIHSSRKRFFCCFNPFFRVCIFIRKHYGRFAVGRLLINFLR